MPGIAFLGHGDDARVARKVADLVDFYLLPPEPRWLPDGYDDDDVQAWRFLGPWGGRLRAGQPRRDPLFTGAPGREAQGAALELLPGRGGW